MESKAVTGGKEEKENTTGEHKVSGGRKGGRTEKEQSVRERMRAWTPRRVEDSKAMYHDFQMRTASDPT